MNKDISYQDYTKQNDIHGTVLYPAPMIAPVQKDVLKFIIKDNKIKTIFDPFFGSGTSLYEAFKIDKNIELYGCDINPLAYLITQTKLQGVDSTIDSDIKILEQILANQPADDYTFENINKWFREDIADELKKIRLSINQITNEKNRKYFWCMFIDIIRKYSNTRSSTYKLHVKQDDKIKKMKNNVITDYIKYINKNKKYYNLSSNNFKLYKNDILEQIKKFPKKMMDISITSPPYGDNHTTVTYGQFSSLALRWIDTYDMELDGWELNNYSIIDSKSIGGSSKPINLSEEEKKLIQQYISGISQNKQNKVLFFFNDYFEFLHELCKITNKYIIMTLGNRTVDGVQIDLTSITTKFLNKSGFINIENLSRDIPNKRIPPITSVVNKKQVPSMNSEYVIIHERVC